MDNNSEESEVQEKVKEARERELNDLRKIISTEEGKNFFCRLLTRGRIYTTTFTGNSQGMFNEGERNLALWVLGELTETELEQNIKDILFKTRKGV